jgi:uncharacterized RDD family membrane protein YckC
LLSEQRGEVHITVYDDSVSKILSILAHPLRRKILSFIHEKGECSFTDLLNVLEVDTGKLSFHLRALSVFTEQTSAGKYRLSKTGVRALHVIRDVELWAENANIKGKPADLPYASFARRSYAFLIDAVLMLGVTMLFTLPEFLVANVLSLTLSAVPFVTLVLVFVYSTLLEGFSGQTLGKRVVGLKVVRLDGKALDYEHSAVRNFGKTFLLPLDLLIGLRHDKFIRYFDKFAGTSVIDLRARAKSPPNAVEVQEKVPERPSQMARDADFAV